MVLDRLRSYLGESGSLKGTEVLENSGTSPSRVIPLGGIEEVRKRLDEVDLSEADSYTVGDVHFGTFSQWATAASSVRDPDKARNILYFGFQPLYDALIRRDFHDGQADVAVRALDKVCEIGREFLTGCYLGEPNVEILREGAKELGEEMDNLHDVGFRPKFKNVDYNHIYPSHIVLFMRQVVDYALDGKMEMPDFIMGCACGSAEIVMPLAGILGVEFGFIRRSYRRGDDAPRIVEAHVDRFKQDLEGLNLLCVEDYVCTGTSLGKVMRRAKEFGPAEIAGVSINNTGNNRSSLTCKVNARKFQMYTLPEG
ncbi:MAG: phosphoribosyltransferase family protein [archaeon]